MMQPGPQVDGGDCRATPPPAEHASLSPASTPGLAADWRTYACLLLAALGLADSIYLTLVHYTPDVHLYCTSGSFVNCSAVTTSPQSVVFGIPVPVYGIAWFMTMAALVLPRFWRSQSRVLIVLRAGLAFAGVSFALYLVAQELLVIGKLCLWCTAAHLLAFAIFVIVLTAAPSMLFRSNPPQR